MMYIGIDPGKDGGIAAIHENQLRLHTIPKIGKLVDLHKLKEILEAYTNYGKYDHIILLENVHSLPGMSAKSNFAFGENKGQWQGLLVALGLKYQEVAPKAWQKVAWEGIPMMKKSNKKTDTKAMSLAAAKRLFPDVDFRRSERATKPHDGLVDATLMAYYMKRTH
jgi:hypothetical protein